MVSQVGPWHFRGNPVIITPYDGYTKPTTIELFKFDIWARIVDLPIAYHGKVKALASQLGEFVDSEPSSFDFKGNFFGSVCGLMYVIHSRRPHLTCGETRGESLL